MTVVYLFDVDNTLLDNDAVAEDLRRFLDVEVGADCGARYWTIFDALREELGYADYLGALQRYRDRHPRDLRVLAVSHFLLSYPFADRVYPGSFEVLERCAALGTVAILSDGDAVFQPRKIWRSGLNDAVGGNVMVYIHKERELDDVATRFPADHYVLVDDKVRILAAVKAAWGARVTTVFPQQGHYAHDATEVARYPAPDVTVERVGALLRHGPDVLVAAARRDEPA